MMKRFVIFAAIAVTGCNTSEVPPTKGEESTLDLLAEGSAEACNREDIRTALLSEIKPVIRPTGDQISQDIEGGMSLLTYSFDTIALAGVDKEIKSVSCDANLTVKYKDHEDRTFQVRYTIRPSVENKQAFVINTVAPEAIQYAKTASSNSVASVFNDRVIKSQNQSEPEELTTEEESSADQNINWTDAVVLEEANWATLNDVLELQIEGKVINQEGSTRTMALRMEAPQEAGWAALITHNCQSSTDYKLKEFYGGHGERLAGDEAISTFREKLSISLKSSIFQKLC